MVFGRSSTIGYTANLTINVAEYTAYKNRLEGEHQKNSIWREIAVIEFVLKAFVHLLKSSSVLYKTNNISPFILVTSGSNEDDLRKTTENIFYFCKENSITLKVMWIPRKELSSVDRLRTIMDHDNWGTTKSFFEILNNL